MIDFFIVSIF